MHFRSITVILVLIHSISFAGDWPQASGPNRNWQVTEVADPATKWSVVRNENTIWETVLPEGGQSAVSVWGNRAFVTTYRVLQEGDALTEPNIIGYCLDAGSGEILWKVDLPGTDPVQTGGIFSDSTVFAPITDGIHVWFFNRCGSMGCYTMEGEKVWLRTFRPRPRHTNRECEPILVGDTILTVEVRDKIAAQKIQRHEPIPKDIDERDIWTYLHAIDKNTGEVKWIGEAGTSIHNTPLAGQLKDGRWAVVHGRGGGHEPPEKPYGVSLTTLSDGKTLWSCDTGPAEAAYFNTHWNPDETYWFYGNDHLVIDTGTGKLLRTQSLSQDVELCRYDESAKAWRHESGVEVNPGKRSPCTNQTNIVVGDWHYFLAHDLCAIARINVKTGKTEYLQVPAQLVAEPSGKNRMIWDKKDAIPNDVKNSRGIAHNSDKRSGGTGWGHVSAASPTLVNHYLFFPIMNGTVYVIDTNAEKLDENALVSINDLGEAGKTWTLASFSYSGGHLFMHTMKEVICIGRPKS